MHATILGAQQPEKLMVVPPPAQPPMNRDIAMNDLDDETSEGQWPDDAAMTWMWTSTEGKVTHELIIGIPS